MDLSSQLESAMQALSEGRQKMGTVKIRAQQTQSLASQLTQEFAGAVQALSPKVSELRRRVETTRQEVEQAANGVLRQLQGSEQALQQLEQKLNTDSEQSLNSFRQTRGIVQNSHEQLEQANGNASQTFQQHRESCSKQLTDLGGPLQEVNTWFGQTLPKNISSHEDSVRGRATRTSQMVQEQLEQISSRMKAFASKMEELGEECRKTGQTVGDKVESVSSEATERLDKHHQGVSQGPFHEFERTTKKLAETVDRAKDMGKTVGTVVDTVKTTSQSASVGLDSLIGVMEDMKKILNKLGIG